MGVRLKNTAYLAVILLTISCPRASADEILEETGFLYETIAGQQLFEIDGSSNLNCSIKIISRQTDRVKISFKKTAGTPSRSESARFLDLIGFKLSVKDDRAVFSILSPSQAPWQGSNRKVFVDILVELPEKMRISGRTKYTGFVIEGPFQGVDLRSTYSNLDLRRIFGPVDATTSFGDIKVEAIRGEIRAETESGKIIASDLVVPSGYALFETSNATIDLKNIQGHLEAYTSHAAITASNIDARDGSVVLRTSHSPVDIRNITGELICETSYDPITIANADINHGQPRIETRHAPITAEFSNISNCELYIATEYNNVILTVPADISARIIAGVGEGGRIKTSNLSLTPTVLDRTRLEAVAGDGDSKIEVSVGDIGSIAINGR